MKKLTFDELREKIDSFAGRPIEVLIRNKGRKYGFDGLKPSVSLSPDLCGVSLNHTYQPQATKRSQFHDDEDVDIVFHRPDVLEILDRETVASDCIYIRLKTFECELWVPPIKG